MQKIKPLTRRARQRDHAGHADQLGHDHQRQRVAQKVPVHGAQRPARAAASARCACHTVRPENSSRCTEMIGRNSSGSSRIISRNGSVSTAPPKPRPERTKPPQTNSSAMTAYLPGQQVSHRLRDQPGQGRRGRSDRRRSSSRRDRKIASAETHIPLMKPSENMTRKISGHHSSAART
jgi:hypothetical protein